MALPMQSEYDIAPAPQHRPGSFRADLFLNLRSGLGLAGLQRTTPADFRPNGGQLAAVILVESLLDFLLRLAVVGRHGYLDVFELSASLFHVPVLLLAGVLIARLCRSDELALVIPLGLVGAAIPPALVQTLLQLAISDRWLPPRSYLVDVDHYFPLYAWWLAAAAVALLRLCEGGRSRLFACAVFMLVVALPLWYIPRGTPWVARQTDDDGGNRRLTVVSEESLYSQPRILEETLESLKPGRPGVIDLYFVGFAGNGEEDVFRHEIDVVSRLFAEHFGTAGRSVALINSPRTLRRAPLATRTALAFTLDQIGRVMNRDEDILFLYLSSHGAETHELDVSFPPLELDPISPRDLREFLDAAGIKWRVVVVSACYSGGFVDALKDPRTLVITASDAEHNSFGCGSESDFTYFGKAYFDEALRHDTSFTGAFTAARRAIRRREEAEGETPSNPQMFVGKEIDRQLQRFGERLVGERRR
jgi:hypothetical protein